MPPAPEPDEFSALAERLPPRAPARPPRPRRRAFVVCVILELGGATTRRLVSATAGAHAAAGVEAAAALRFDYPTLDDAQAAALVAGLTALEDASALGGARPRRRSAAAAGRADAPASRRCSTRASSTGCSTASGATRVRRRRRRRRARRATGAR